MDVNSHREQIIQAGLPLVYDNSLDWDHALAAMDFQLERSADSRAGHRTTQGGTFQRRRYMVRKIRGKTVQNSGQESAP